MNISKVKCDLFTNRLYFPSLFLVQLDCLQDVLDQQNKDVIQETEEAETKLRHCEEALDVLRGLQMDTNASPNND